MDKDNSLVKVQGEDGKIFNMLILKEFDYKNKKYAVLTEFDKCYCEDGCDETCDCGCNEKKECTCDDDCKCNCHEECDCGCKEENSCHDQCGCGHCNDEPMLCLLEILKDKDGNEIFKSIDDEIIFNELVEEADKILFKD